MDVGQYRVRVACKLWKRSEYVFFHEVQIKGEYFLAFDGCDNDFHPCEECDRCRETAYKALIQSVENP